MHEHDNGNDPTPGYLDEVDQAAVDDLGPTDPNVAANTPGTVNHLDHVGELLTDEEAAELYAGGAE